MSPTAPSLPNIRGGSMQEVIFAQRLADNEKKIRDRALNKLKTFLSIMSANGPGFTDEDALKIWKGLFYCMYMADKPLIQEDVAEDMSKLIHELGNLEDARTFTKAAFLTFSREWNGIDVFRIDKFMMLVRRVLRQVLVHLKLQDWDLKEVSMYAKILNTTIIKADDDTNVTSLGLKLHLATIMMEETAKIGGEELDFKALLLLISPYIEVMALSKLLRYRQSVRDDVFRHLMRQSDLGVKFEGLPFSAQQTMVEEEVDEDDEETTMEVPIEDAVLDPRAGECNVYIPQLKVNFSQLGDALQKVGGLKKIGKYHRRGIYTLVKECKDMAGGIYPLGIPDIVFQQLNWRKEKHQAEEAALDRMEEFYENLEKLPAADLKQIGDWEEDPFKNISIKSTGLRKRIKKKRKKLNKLNKLDKPKLSFNQKKKLAVQLAAATVNRKKSVRSALKGITISIGETEESKEKAVTAVADKKSKKRKTQSEDGDSPKKLKKSEEANTLVPEATKTKKKKKKKRKISEEAHIPVPVATKTKKKKNKKVKMSEEAHTLPEATKAKKERKKNVVKQSDDKISTSSTEGKTETAKEKKENLIEKSDSDMISVSATGGKTESPKRKKKKEVVKHSDSVATADEKSNGERVKVDSPPKEVEATTGLCPIVPGSGKTKKKKKTKQTKEELCTSPLSDKGVEGVASEPPAKISTVETTTLVSKDAKVKNIFEVPEFSSSETKTPGQKKSKVGKDGNSKAKSKTQETPEVMSAKKKKAKNSNKVLSNSENSIGTSLNADKMSISPKKTEALVLNLSEGKKKSVWGKSLEEKEIDVFLKERRRLKLAQRRASLSSPKGTPKTPRTSKSMRERTIKINLKENQEHDFKDYANSVRNSPQIPYKANQVPMASVLKPSPSPILIGRQGLKILKNVLRKSPGSKGASPALRKKSPKVKKLNRKKAADFF